MAYVTRCPYCGAVWLLPNREVAEESSVKCSACNHSFDATCALLQVPDRLFPGVHFEAARKKEPVKPAVPLPIREHVTPAAESAHDPAASPVVAEKNKEPETAGRDVTSGAKPEEQKPAVKQEEQATPENRAAGEEPQKEKTESVPEEGRKPAVPETAGSRTEPKIGDLSKATRLAVAENLGIRAEKAPAKKAEGLPQEKLEEPQKPANEAVKPAALPAPEKSPLPRIRVEPDASKIPMAARPRKGSFLSTFLALIILVAIAAVGAVVFNQKIIEVYPQTKEYFMQLCTRLPVPCPGFYLSNIEAFVVTKSNLRSLDESGHYVLEASVINGSGHAQAIPDLQIEFVDDADTTLLQRTIFPEQYLDDAMQGTTHIGPNSTLNIRFNIESSVTPARCIVKPVYSNH